MRRRLREQRKESIVDDTLRIFRGMIESLHWSLPNTTAGASTTGSDFEVLTVLELPDIPTTPGTHAQVFWTSAGAGNGDDQEWQTYAGKTRWYPSWFPTDKSGVPL